jgi:Protein of unknown function (DUF3429)
MPEPSSLALRLGYGGLLPFAVGAILVWWVRADALPYLSYLSYLAYAARGLAAYGALIVSFLGGIHWGLAMRQAQPSSRLLIWGILPSLVVWPALLMPPGVGLVIIGMMLLICYAVDRVLYAEHGVAAWLNLRFRLSMVAALCCFVGAAGT